MKTPEQAWIEAKPHINGAQLAKRLGISRAAVSAWTKAPAERVTEISRITGIGKQFLRPDLYPPDPWVSLERSLDDR